VLRAIAIGAVAVATSSLSASADAATSKHPDSSTTTSHPASTATTHHPAAPFTGKITCRHVPPSQPAVATVPVRISTTSTSSRKTTSGTMLVTVGVCIGKRGPYPFVVDTGSTRSIIASGLASNLHLKRAGTIALGGSGCATTGSLVKMPVLHLKAIAIAPQQMVSANLSSWSGKRVDGVLGSDILGRFGAIKLDLPRYTLTFAGAEGPAPVSHELILGKAGATLPTSLLRGPPAAQVPLTIVQSPGSIATFTYVSVAHQGPYAFLVDTGSPTSSISTTAGFHLLLADKGTATAPGGVGCAGTVPTLAPTSVVMGSAPPSTLALRAVKIKGPQRAGIVGALGLDVLGTYGAIIVDYQGGNLALARG
jgi:Aspartyl protease